MIRLANSLCFYSIPSIDDKSENNLLADHPTWLTQSRHNDGWTEPDEWTHFVSLINQINKAYQHLSKIWAPKFIAIAGFLLGLENNFLRDAH